MPSDENRQPSPTLPESTLGRRPRDLVDNALQLGPRKKAYVKQVQLSSSMRSFGLCCHRSYQDPLVHHGRHFGRTIHGLCRVHAVINNGLVIQAELLDLDPEGALGLEETLPFEYV